MTMFAAVPFRQNLRPPAMIENSPAGHLPHKSRCSHLAFCMIICYNKIACENLTQAIRFAYDRTTRL